MPVGRSQDDETPIVIGITLGGLGERLHRIVIALHPEPGEAKQEKVFMREPGIEPHRLPDVLGGLG